MPEGDLKKRLDQKIYESKRRRWFTRWWGILAIIGGFFAITVVVLFLFMMNFYFQKISSGELLTRAVDSVEQEARLDLLHNGEDPSLGPSTAPVTIVAFEDFECPFCLEAQPFIKRLLTKYDGEIRFIYKDFPLSAIHPNAQSAAEAAQCAFEQGKFWEMHDELFADQGSFAEAHYRTLAKKIGLNINQYNECYAGKKHTQQINEDIQLGRTLGVVGTPTFFMNGEFFVQGYGSELEDAFDTAIEYIKGL